MNEHQIPEWNLVEERAETLIKRHLSKRVMEKVRAHRAMSHAIRIQGMVTLAMVLVLNAVIFFYPSQNTSVTQSDASSLSAERKELLKSL